MKNNPILACITAQPHCVEIINAARIMAQQLETKIIVVTAQPVKMNAQERSENVKCLNEISKKCGVDIVVRYGDDPAKSIAIQALVSNPLHIFIGEDNGFLKKFRILYAAAPISVVAKDVVCTIPPMCETC